LVGLVVVDNRPGANDAYSPEVAPNWGVPVQTFKANLITMLDFLTSPDSPYGLAHSTDPLSIILITPPYVHNPMLDHPGKLDNDHIRHYRDAVLAIAREWEAKQAGQRWKVGVIDLFGSLERRIENDGSPERYYTSDLSLEHWVLLIYADSRVGMACTSPRRDMIYCGPR
jgi:hypothetical protein